MEMNEFIDKYIQECDNVIRSKSTTEAKKLQSLIIGAFTNNIPQIKNDLYRILTVDQYHAYIENISILKQKLEMYKINIQQEKELRQHELELAKYKQNNVNANAVANPTQSSIQTVSQTNSVEISVKSTIKGIEDISSSALDVDDKEKLKEYIYSLEGVRGSKEKAKFWEKSKEVLKFLADKTMDAAVTVLPYIIYGMQSIP